MIIIPDIASLRIMLEGSGVVDMKKITDTMLTQKFTAAYAQAQRELRVFFEPTEVIPDDAEQAEIDALELAGKAYHQESAYDYNPSLLLSTTFSFIKTKQSPIIDVHSMALAYPAPNNTIFEIPKAWLRLDKKYGQIQLVPIQLGFSLPFMGYLLGTAQNIPFLLRIRYTAGLKNIATEWPDIIELLNRMAVLNVLKMAFLPGQQSLSFDGFSRSVSITIADWQSSVDGLMDSLRDSIHGIRMGVL